MSKYATNLAAEYCVLAALWRQGVEAYLTFGNKKAMDIRIVHSPRKALGIEVKGVAGKDGWPIQARDWTIESALYFALVSFNKKRADLSVSPDIWIVPAKQIDKFVSKYKDKNGSHRHVVSRQSIERDGCRFKNDWEPLLP